MEIEYKESKQIHYKKILKHYQLAMNITSSQLPQIIEYKKSHQGFSSFTNPKHLYRHPDSQTFLKIIDALGLKGKDRVSCCELYIQESKPGVVDVLKEIKKTNQTINPTQKQTNTAITEKIIYKNSLKNNDLNDLLQELDRLKENQIKNIVNIIKNALGMMGEKNEQ